MIASRKLHTHERQKFFQRFPPYACFAGLDA